jgi:copper chaperone CopZ
MTNAERTYTVNGMTCGHCALSVREEVIQVAGVEQVEVDLDSGRLDVAGGGFSDEEVQAAVASAGYELAAPARNGGAGGDAGD